MSIDADTRACHSDISRIFALRTAAMPSHRTVRLPERLITAAEQEAATMNRSLAGQVEYWASIGRAFERTPGFTFERIRAALNGDIEAASLNADERDYFNDMVGSVIDQPTAKGAAFWAGFDRSTNTDL